MEEGYDQVKGAWEERFESRYGRWRGFVDGVVYAFTDCGELSRGFARVYCDACGREFLLAFSCRSYCTASGRCVPLLALGGRLQAWVVEQVAPRPIDLEPCQASLGLPFPYCGRIEINLCCQLGGGQQASLPKSIITALKAVDSLDAPNASGVEGLALPRYVAALVENRGNLSSGVVVEKLIDLADDLGGGLPLEEVSIRLQPPPALTEPRSESQGHQSTVPAPQISKVSASSDWRTV